MSALVLRHTHSAIADLAPSAIELHSSALPTHCCLRRRLDCILLTYIEALTARPVGMSPTTNAMQVRACWLPVLQ